MYMGVSGPSLLIESVDSMIYTYKIIVVSLCVCPSVTEGQWTQFDLEIQNAVPHKPIHEFQVLMEFIRTIVQ